MKVLISVGTRPNFIKVTQFKRVAKEIGGIEVKIAHTGQHYDHFMSGVFFDQFKLHPDYFLSLESSSPANQLGEITMKISNLIDDYRPDLVLVPGDVNSTLAAALAAHKSGVQLAHLEAGLRSYDRTMPEEVNRILTDEISDLFYVTEPSGEASLLGEGKLKEQIHIVGNTMIDTLVAFEPNIEKSKILEEYRLEPGGYALMTMHRPATVDSSEGLSKLLTLIEEITSRMPVVFPMHPRTLKNITLFGLDSRFEKIKRLITTGPMAYFDFQKLIKYSNTILTDSGGIQEESTYRKVRCLTLRDNTERPITCTIGSNTLVGLELDNILEKFDNPTSREFQIPDLWDGQATTRILNTL